MDVGMIVIGEFSNMVEELS